jgi:glycerophosphoryl diester phosphodiesterase
MRLRKSKATVICLAAALSIALLVGVIRQHGAGPAGSIPSLHQSEKLIFAHRGGRSLGPENTLYAFERALAFGAHVLELDTRLTKDGRLVVIHDATVDRTTDGKGDVNGFLLKDIGRLDAAFNYSEDGGLTFPLRNNGVTIPSLVEVLRRFPNTAINIELKDDSHVAADTLCRLMPEYGTARKVIVASFHSKAVRHFRSICPDISTAATVGEVMWFTLLSKLHLEHLYRPRASVLQIPEKAYGIQLVTRRFLDAAHSQGLKVHVWNVNHPIKIEKYFSMGVDGIMTDSPQAVGRESGSPNFHHPR